MRKRHKNPSTARRVCFGALLAATALATAPVVQAQEKAAATLTRDEVREILRDARRIVVPQGIEELKPVQIGGIPQWISVRGRDRRNPILLVVHGGPGYPEMPSSWLWQAGWEDYFTVVHWDQRGVGKTAASSDMAAVEPTIHHDRLVKDGEEVVAYLRAAYGKRKIFVLGHSWGTVIGTELARTHPDWLHAYIGVGQLVYWRDNERVGYEFALRQARAHGDTKALAELASIAPYPGPDGTVSNEQLWLQRRWVIRYGGLTWGRQNLAFERNAARISPDYTDADEAARRSSSATMPYILPALNRIDYRNITRFDCPVFLFAGEYDFETPSDIAAAWLAGLKAPAKRFFWYGDVAHELMLEVPGKMLVDLVQHVRPLAVRAGDAAPADRYRKNPS